ncbi:sensor histidine kinase [Leucobacter aridicollis]|uniref:histidine kinase n=1 Tax=Leucobacter aridicollis TaxID=283878 RepID=A0A852R2H0_9MICO|nr:HAMP domain-containing sensor histidine kinase [Leucobacter aridicollis]NYD25825.1 signal transduction histidine kinase [Leucobacter aridicollis]
MTQHWYAGPMAGLGEGRAQMARARMAARRLPDEEAYRRSASKIGWQVMAVCAALVVIGGAVILGFVFWQTTPTEAAKPAQPGEIEVRLDPGELILATVLLATGAILCAGLAARLIARRAVYPLDEAFRLQRRFVADVSHELRTPLAVIDARAQQLAALTPPGDARQPVLVELRQDARIMADVIDAMLATASGGEPGSGSAPLAETIAAVARDLGEVARPFGVSIAADSEELTVAAPTQVVRRCLVALTDNAIDHAPAGSTVTIVGAARGADAVVTVSDSGDGIQGISPDRVFDRFAQGATPATARGAARTSRGIGLALVRELCAAHGGSVGVASSGPGGTTFELSFPLADRNGDE